MSRPVKTLHPRTRAGLGRAFRWWAHAAHVEELPDVAGASDGERHLLGALGGIAAVIGGERVADWPEPLRRWATLAPPPPEVLTEAIREGLGRWHDPLCVLYDASISAAHRRRLGTVFTPEPMVEHMLAL